MPPTPDPSHRPATTIAVTTVTYVAWSVGRLSGMERAALDLAHELAGQVRTEVIIGRTSAITATIARGEAGPATVQVGVLHLLRAALWPRRGQIVVVVGIFTIARLALLPGVHRSRIVLWEHSITPDRLTATRRMRALARLARRSYRRASVICPSQAVAAALIGLRSPTPTVIPNIMLDSVAAAAGRHKTRLNSERITIGVVGRLEPVRNPVLALDVIEQLDDRFHLDVFGDGSELPLLRSETHRRGLSDRVTLHGWVDDRSRIMSTIDVLLSLSASETFGYSLLEAAAAHVPVIALGVGAVAEVVPSHAPGCVVATTSPAAIAATVRALADNFPSIAEFEAAAALRHREFGPRAITETWCAFLGIGVKERPSTH